MVAGHILQKYVIFYQEEILSRVLIGANKDKDVINDIILKTDTALNLYNLSPLNTYFFSC